MSQAVVKALSTANAEIGYLEKKSNSYLDDKTKNAGSNNYTKYARDLVSWIGSPYAQGQAWCDMFVDWVMIKSFGKDIAKKMIGGWSAYTPTSAQYYKNMGRWYTTPKVGDQIFFKNSSRICHTGIVYGVDKSYVYTIEGNTSGASGVVANGGGVCQKKYVINYKNIAGYGRPKYELVSTTSSYMFNNLDMSPVFDPVFYANKYPDLKAAFGNNNSALFNHFTTCGMNEARQAISTFDPVKYRAAYPDLNAAFGNNWPSYYMHYVSTGKNEIESGARKPFIIQEIKRSL